MSDKKYRVVQWATGNIGLRSLRAVIEHPQLELVGLRVYSDAKAGRDAGDLVGLPPTGVIATRDIDEILALKPDCVLYMPDRAEIEVLCRLLESGANVVSTRGEFHRPESMDPAVRDRIEAACQQGGTSLHSSGSTPGFITEAVPLVLLSIQRRLDRLTIDEFSDMSSRNSPEMIFDLMGFGQTRADFDLGRFAVSGGGTGSSMQMVADAIGLPIDSIESTGEVAVACSRVEIAAGIVEAGTVAAQRQVVSCLRNGEPLLSYRSHRYLTTDLDPAWDLRQTGWRILVEGDTPLDIDVRFPVSEEDYPAMSPGLTAHRPVNAIPYVVAAEPGIRTTADLPQVIAHFGTSR
jgi:hypothetical protein